MTWRAKWHPYLACGFSNVAAPGPFGFVSEDVAGQRGDFDRVPLLGRRRGRVVVAQVEVESRMGSRGQNRQEARR